MASNPPSPSSPSRQAAPTPCQPPEDVVYRRTSPRPRETDNSQNHVLLSRNAAVQLSWDGATHPAQLELRHNRGLSHGFIRLRLLNILLHETKGAQAFYAYIPPESIQHMSLVSPAAEEGPGETASEASDTCVHRLCFELLRPPDVFGPNCTWTGRDLESVAMLESLAGLASATSLVVLVPTRVAKQTQWGAFSAIASKGSMRSIETLYYTKSLYGGNGARRHGSVAPDAGPLLPSYTEASVPSYAGPSNRAGPSTNAAFTGQRALKRPRRSSSLPAEAISSHPPKRVDTRPRETPGQPLVTHADLARLYGGNGGRLQTPDSFPLLRPPPYMPEDAADLTASDDASAPAYESKAPANHCQATMGESSRRHHRRPRSSGRAPARRFHRRPRGSAHAPARRFHRRPRSSPSPEVKTASAGCRKCDELFPFLTQKLGDITTQLTRTNRHIDTGMAALGARLAAEWHRAAQEEEVRRTAEEKKVRESLVREVRETIRSQFFERDVLVETVAARVNAEMDYQVKVATNYINAHIGAQMDGVRDYVDQLKEHLEECLANEMRTGGE